MVALGMAAAYAMLFPLAAGAADRIYWKSTSSATIAFANLDGSGGMNVDTTGITTSAGGGVAIDAAAGRVYWGNDTMGKISYADADGSGGAADLNTSGAQTEGIKGIAIDPAAGKLFWASDAGVAADRISFALLDGSGGANLNTTGATVDDPQGVAIDVAANRIYWINLGSETISYANLDNTGGGADVPISGTTITVPVGLALELSAGRIYWDNYMPWQLSFADLDGSDGDELFTVGASPGRPFAGMAIDQPAGRIYWANNTDAKISFGSLAGGGVTDLSTAGATIGNPIYPALLKAPVGTGIPVLSGAGAPGSELSCTQGSWAPDLLGSHHYRVPRSFAYQWTLNGSDVAGATASSHTAVVGGEYRCEVTAENDAGATTQTSSPHTIIPSNDFSLGKAVLNRRKGTARLPVTVPGPGEVSLSGRKVVAQGSPRGARSARSVGAAGTVRLLVKARGKARRRLSLTGKAKVVVTVTYLPSGGSPSSRTRKLTLRRRV